MHLGMYVLTTCYEFRSLRVKLIQKYQSLPWSPPI
jgi:hypothetical protein